MRVQFETLVIGKEDKVSKQTGKNYTVASFMDGVKPLQGIVMCDANTIQVGVPQLLTVDINIGKYTKIEVLECKKIS